MNKQNFIYVSDRQLISQCTFFCQNLCKLCRPWACPKMRRLGKEPRLLPNVMEAIASLREKQGSTQKQIVDHIAHILRKNKDTSRNVTVQVRRALEHGIQSGLIKQRSGKYTLGLDKRDYAIFRRFRQISDPNADCNSCKRRGRRRGKRRSKKRRGRRGGRRRRYASVEDEMTDETDSGRSVTAGTPEPMDRGRRGRRKRGRKHKRRSRKHRRHAAPDEANSDSSVTGNKESTPAVAPEKRRSDQEKMDYPAKSGSNHNHHQERHQERNRQDMGPEEDDMEDCGNPECLCNIKQEDDSPRCMSRENNYYNDSYLN